ncbi:Short-chain dehydrogenase/reductase tropE [Fusarium oxysporum f. sp. albedinis]|nr:Short-chain dehydrogenase/reductase tropE [Fusarium oxysporum f. sp. albedinis]
MESDDIILPSPLPSAFSFLRPPRNLASQFELTTQSALPDHPTVIDLPRVIKRHGIFLIEINTNNSLLSPYWAYHLCNVKGQPKFFAAATTTADLDLLTDKSKRPKRRRLQYSIMLRARVKTIRELSLGLLINTNIPFSFFSNTFF